MARKTEYDRAIERAVAYRTRASETLRKTIARREAAIERNFWARCRAARTLPGGPDHDASHHTEARAPTREIEFGS